MFFTVMNSSPGWIVKIHQPIRAFQLLKQLQNSQFNMLCVIPYVYKMGPYQL